MRCYKGETVNTSARRAAHPHGDRSSYARPRGWLTRTEDEAVAVADMLTVAVLECETVDVQVTCNRRGCK